MSSSLDWVVIAIYVCCQSDLWFGDLSGLMALVIIVILRFELFHICCIFRFFCSELNKTEWNNDVKTFFGIEPVS